MDRYHIRWPKKVPGCQNVYQVSINHISMSKTKPGGQKQNQYQVCLKRMRRPETLLGGQKLSELSQDQFRRQDIISSGTKKKKVVRTYISWHLTISGGQTPYRKDKNHLSENKPYQLAGNQTIWPETMSSQPKLYQETRNHLNYLDTI